MSRLTPHQTHETIGMLRYAIVSDIARFLARRGNNSPCTGSKKGNRNRQTPRSDTPKVKTGDDDRTIRTARVWDRYLTAAHTARAFYVRISRFIVGGHMSE